MRAPAAICAPLSMTNAAIESEFLDIDFSILSRHACIFPSIPRPPVRYVSGDGSCKTSNYTKKERLLEKVARISKRLKSHADLFYNIENVGDVRTGGLLMGIEMVSDRRTKIPIRAKGTSINKIVFDEGRKNGIYLRTLGNVVMLVPPLAISKSVLDTLVEKTEKTIRAVVQKL